MSQAKNLPPDPDQEYERARELLERTVRFLALCAEDPEKGLESDDPQALIQGLRALAVEPVRAEGKEPRTIQIRHRRSA